MSVFSVDGKEVRVERIQAFAKGMRWIGTALFLISCSLIFSSCSGKDRRSTTIPPPPLPAPPPAVVEKPPVKIRILLAENFSEAVIDGSREGLGLGDGKVIVTFAGNDEVGLFSEEAGERQLLRRGSGFRLEAAAGCCLALNGRPYRGIFEVFVNPVGVPVIVNEVEVEQYLRSVVPRELGPKKFPEVEALKAQAVAARTFAVAGLGTWVRYGFDLYRDSRSQVYDGIATEIGLSDEAIAETDREVAIYEGEPILALYSSTCGGETEDFSLIFKGGPISYLKGGALCSDQESPYYNWQESIDVSSIQSSLDQYAGVGRLLSLEPLGRGVSDRIVKMRFTGEDGSVELKGNDIRFALGLRSNLILNFEADLDEEGFITRLDVSGRGWGHGVGMCQVGAVHYAREGWDYEQILKHYYDGIQIEQWSR
ncbi:MAG: SpoIID/LytB domain-containing protein [Acidobacteriota bacterium]|nr:MAG: SpoIID/LytB domain-containing protein [Acidobacteriota bacterium]